jgi:hypothetical protein
LKFNLKYIATPKSFPSFSHSISIPFKLNFKFLSCLFYLRRITK